MGRTSRYLWLTLAGLALAALSPAAARAGCGHYVLVLGSPRAEAPPQTGQPAGPSGDARDAPPAPAPPGPRPCSGPGCSEGRPPLPAPPTTVSPGEERWGLDGRER